MWLYVSFFIFISLLSCFQAENLYVDDIVLTSSNPHLMSLVNNLLNNHFKIKDLGRLKYFLGIEVAR
jgi:hypothetical protein